MGDATSIQREMFRIIEKHDLDGLRKLYHQDYAYTGTDGVEQKGAEAGVAVARTYTTAFPDLSFEVLTQHSAGKDTAIGEVRARGTHKEELDGIPATGREITLELCSIVQVRDGKVVRERDYYDTAEMLKQLGVMEG